MLKAMQTFIAVGAWLACGCSSTTSSGQAAAVQCGAREDLGLPGESRTITFPGCSDGHTYEVKCPDCKKTPYTCSCSVDGKATGQSITTSSALCVSDPLPEINAGCGWNVN